MATAPTPIPRAPVGGASSAELEIGSMLAERYRVLGTLGAGRMGKVYLAEHGLLRKKLAIKVLHRDLASVPDLLARFEREAMATGNIGHPNVAAATDFGRLPDGSMFLALEYVEGRTLRAELEQAFSVERALRIALQIASGLAAAHALGIVHRDLKPENVMLVARGEERDLVKVLDFGIARFSDPAGRFVSGAPLTLPSTVFGTPEYMPPEQALGQPVDGRADLFSLGVILFEMVAGARPFDAPNLGGVLSQQLAGPPPSLGAVRPTLPKFAALDHLLGSLLARRPEERPASAALVIQALEACLADPALDAAPVAVAVAVPVPVPVNREPPRQLPTFLPGDPLPSFALPGEGESVASDAVDAPTLFVASRGSLPAAAPDAGVAVLPSARPVAAPPSPPAAAQVLLVERVARGALGVVRALRSRLPLGLARPLRKIPDEVLLVSLAAFVVVAFFVVLLWVLRSGRAEPSPVSAPSAAPAAAPVAAPRGPEVTPVAASSAPNDTDALLDRARTDVLAGRDAAALAAVSRVLSLHPNRRDDERVATVLFRTAAAADKKVSDTTFALLQGTMAARGSEILYRIALDKSMPEPTRRAAERWLRGDQLKQASSSDLLVAVKLRFAATCAERRELLPMAGKAGKSLTLDVLRELRQERGCGFSGQDDCYPCLRGESQLTDAISAIEKRGG